MEEIAEALESVEDKDSAEAAAERIKELAEEGEALEKEVDKEKFKNELKEEAEAAEKRLKAAITKIMKNHPELMATLAPAFEKMGK